MEGDLDSYFGESSDNEEVAAPLYFNLEVNLEESPESPPPGPPSPVLPQPIPLGQPAPNWELPDDDTNFLNFYTRVDIVEIKNWAQVTRGRINEKGYFVEEPLVSQSLAAFLRQNYGPQWEWKLLPPSAEIIFENLLAYISGSSWLTGFNRRLLGQQFENWTEEEKSNQLQSLAESSGFLEIVSCSSPSVVGGLLVLGGLLYVQSSSLLCGFVLWNCTSNKNIFGFLNCFWKGM